MTLLEETKARLIAFEALLQNYPMSTLKRKTLGMAMLLHAWVEQSEQQPVPKPQTRLLDDWGDLPDDAGLLSMPPPTPPQKAGIPARALINHVAGKAPYLVG